MVDLLVAYHIDHVVDGIIAVAKLCRANILGDVNGGTIRTEQDLLVKPLRFEIGPNRRVALLLENALFYTAQYLIAANGVGIRFVIDLVEIDAKGLVGFVETSIHPTVHHFP